MHAVQIGDADRKTEKEAQINTPRFHNETFQAPLIMCPMDKTRWKG
jgi:hypothetical protein